MMKRPVGSLILLSAMPVFAVACGAGSPASDNGAPFDAAATLPRPALTVVATSQGPGIPELTADDIELIRQIALADPRLASVLAGREYELGEPFIWHSSHRLEKLGGGMIVTFTEPFTLEREWIQLDYDETEASSPPFQPVVVHFKAEDIEELYLRIDLLSQELVEMAPMGGRASNYTPPADFTPFPTSATPRD